MSRLFDNLRSRLAEAFNLTSDAPHQLPDARGLTLTAYLPDEERAIDAVFAVTQVHKIAAATARRIEEPGELSRAGGLSWSLAMTFYVAAAERERLEAETSAILASLGGSLADELPPPLGRRAA